MVALARRPLFAALAVLFLVAGCADVFAPAADRVRVTFQPRFAEHDDEAGSNPALRVDNVRVVVVDEAGDTVIDQVVLWPLDQDTLRLDVVLEVAGSETFSFGLQGREGELVLFDTGPQDIELTGGSGAGVAIQPVLQYAGPEAELTGVDVVDAPAELAAGGSADLGAVGLDGDGAPVADPLVAWTSLDTLVATVDDDGLVTAKRRVGVSARIVARVAFRTLADTVEIPIQPDTVVMDRSADTINAIGYTVTLKAAALATTGEPALGASRAWSVDPAVARIRFAAGDSAVVSAVGVGTAAVRVTVGSRSDSAVIAVRQVVRGVAIVPGRALLGTADTIALTAVAVDSGGTTIPDPSLTWSSGGSAVTVDANGVARAQATGSAQVTATAQGVSGSAQVAVGGTGSAAVVAGDFHRCRLDTAGQAHCWGTNEFGQLGDGTFTDRAQPVPVLGGLTFTALTAGGNHTCGIATDGGTYCWGGNGFGQLGDGTLVHRTSPTPAGGPALVALSAGGRHTCGLDAAGAAYCWGLDEFGQLGDGIAGDNSVPTPQAVAGGLVFTSIAAGWLHTCGLDAAGTAHCWGRGTEGQLGDGGTADTALPAAVQGGHTFTALTVGAAHTCAVDGAGAGWCWGYNSSGQLGTGALAQADAPTPLDTALTLSHISAGWVHTCGRTTAGQVHCWGSNAALELGRGAPRASESPVPAAVGALDSIVAGGRRTCGLTGAVIVCWGGVPPELLGRDELVIPSPADPPVGRSATR